MRISGKAVSGTWQPGQVTQVSRNPREGGRGTCPNCRKEKMIPDIASAHYLLEEKGWEERGPSLARSSEGVRGRFMSFSARNSGNKHKKIIGTPRFSHSLLWSDKKKTIWADVPPVSVSLWRGLKPAPSQENRSAIPGGSGKIQSLPDLSVPPISPSPIRRSAARLPFPTSSPGVCNQKPLSL